MASDNEASCVSDPNFAVICSFLDCFGKSCGVEYPDIALLQEMVENAQEVPQQLIDLHVKLLRKTRKTVSAEKWERALVKFCHTYSNQDGWELERFGYKKARIAVKLRLLKVLLEAQFDMNQRFKNEVNKLAANELRVEPLGRDKSGLAYWCQLDEECNIRVYREDLDEESWQLVAKDRDGVVNLISTLSNGEAGDIPVNEDSNSLEISEKPIIDTGQVASSPSLEDENSPSSENREDLTSRVVDAVGADGKTLEEADSADEDLEDEEEDEEDDEEGEDDEQGEEEEEEEEEEVDEEEDGDEEVEDGDLTNDESSQQNTEEEDSQDAATGVARSESTAKKIIRLENQATAALPGFESKKIRNPEASEMIMPISADIIRGKVSLATEIAGREVKGLEMKHIETTVIKTSPIKVVNISELTKPTLEERKLDVKVPIGITLIPVTKPIAREEFNDVAKLRDNLTPKSNIFYSASSEAKLSQNKISLTPIEKLAANLVKMQSEKLDKPSSGIKSLEKIAENLARSSGIHGINVTSPQDDDRQIPDFFPRNQAEKSTPLSRSQRGMDLSTSPRGWESLGDRNRPVDFSGMDLSSRKAPAAANNDLPSPGYRPHDFQHKEIDLSTRKPGRPDLSSSIPYDARTSSRSHGMVADLSKRQTLPPISYAGYELPPAYRNTVEHRLPNYSILSDPSKIAAARLGGGGKRPLEDDDAPHDITKRIHTDVIPIRGTIDKRQLIGNCNWRGDEVGEAIEEPIMMVQGEGSGSDCDAVNPGIGEAVEEPVIYFYGEGLGRECDTGNPADDTSPDNEDSKESKNESKSSTNEESESTSALDNSSAGLKTTENYSRPSTSADDNYQALETATESTEVDKTRFKPTLGVQIFAKTSGSPVKRLSRWDVRRPVEKNSNEHDPGGSEARNRPEDESGSSELSTIKESAAESHEPEPPPEIIASNSQMQSCDITKSDISEPGEREEPCRHDSSIDEEPGAVNTAAENSSVRKNDEDISEPEFTENQDLPCEEEGDDDSIPRFFFGPNCVSYNLKNEENKDDAVSTIVNIDTDSEPNVSESGSPGEKQTENESIAKLADDLAKTVSIEKSTDFVPANDSFDSGAEISTDFTAQRQCLDEAVDRSVPEISTEKSTDPVTQGESIGEEIHPRDKSADCITVDERFEKLAVSEAEITGVDKTLDSISDDENFEDAISPEDQAVPTIKETTDFIPVSKSFEKLVVSEVFGAESETLLSENEVPEVSNDPETEITQFKEPAHCLSTNNEDEESTDCISESGSLEKVDDSITQEKSIDSQAKADENLSEKIDSVSNTQNIEESIDFIEDTENSKEATDSTPGIESKEKILEESASPEKPRALKSVSLLHPESIEESKESQSLTEAVEDSSSSLTIDESIKTADESQNKIKSTEQPSDQLDQVDSSDNQKLKEEEGTEEEEQQLDSKEQNLGGEAKTQEDNSERQSNLDAQEKQEQEFDKEEVRESDIKQSSAQTNESQLSDQLPESQTISELETSVNEDELLKSSSDSEQDQNPQRDKANLEEELLWSSQSEAAENIVDKDEENVCEEAVNKDQETENQTEAIDKLESKLETKSSIEEINIKNISDSVKNPEIVPADADQTSKALDSLSKTSLDDNPSQDIKLEASNESKELNKITENTPADEKLVNIPQTELLNNADQSSDCVAEETVDDTSPVEQNKDKHGLPKKEEFYFNKITPTAIIDSNISKSPERITVDSKNRTEASALADIADDYCDPASENPSSSADQDSNEAMVIDDRVYDSNESSKDLGDGDCSNLNEGKVEGEKKVDSNIDASSENKNEESCFNLKNISGSSKQDIAESLPIQIDNKSTFQTEIDKDQPKDQKVITSVSPAGEIEKETESEITEDNLLGETKCDIKTVEKCTVESELEEGEDAVENLTQDASTDDQKSLVANYDSSDRESDDVFENDLIESTSNVDEFNDTIESNELLLAEKDKEENLLAKIDESNDKVETDVENLPKSKLELSDFNAESKTELETHSKEDKIAEENDEEVFSHSNVLMINTESPVPNLEAKEEKEEDEITQAKTTSVEINSQKEETNQVKVSLDEKFDTDKPSESTIDEKTEENINTEDTKENWKSPEEVFNTELKSEIHSEERKSEIETEFTDEKMDKSAEETGTPPPINEAQDKERIKDVVETHTAKDEEEKEPGKKLSNSTISNSEDLGDNAMISKGLDDDQLTEEGESVKETNKLAISKNEPLSLTVTAKHSLDTDAIDLGDSDQAEDELFDDNQLTEEGESVKETNKPDVSKNEPLSLTVTAKHSLDTDAIDLSDSDQAEDELFDEEPPVVHHSKRFKEDLNVPMLDDDKRELKVISLFAKDLKKKECADISPASDFTNHSVNYTKLEKGSQDPENLRTSVILDEDEKTTTTLENSRVKDQEDILMSGENSPLETAEDLLSKDEKVEKSDISKGNSDVPVILPVVTETLEFKNAVDIEKSESKKMEEQIPNSEDILSLKSKQFQLLTKSNETVPDDPLKFTITPENSITELVINRTEAKIVPMNETFGKIQPLLDTQLVKKIHDEKHQVESEIQSVDLKLVTIESDDSMGADNDDAFSNPQDEIDPLACIDEDPKDTEVNAAALGIRVKPVSELVYEGWKLDGTETPKICRKRRNSNHESNSEDVLMKDEDDESEGTGGKRMRLRGKRPPDMNLRRTIEEKRQEAASSDDETVKKPTDLVMEEVAKEDGEDPGAIDSVSNDKKTRGRPKGKRKVRRTIRLPGRTAPTVSNENQTPGADSSMGTDPSSTGVLTSPAISSDTPQKKRKKRKMVLGLEIGRDIVDTSQPGALILDNPVRQSRRIAQIKIKEEADRRRMEEETLCDLKEKKDRDVVSGGGDKKKRKKQKAESEEEEEEEEISSKEIERDTKAKKKRKKKKRKKKFNSSKFDELNPWRSSSGSSTEEDNDNDEDDEEDEEAESEGSVLFKSDHEFSPESDLEKDEESEPLRRARTAQKAQSDDEEADDEYACQKCGKADHPEWILLCDTCDKGWHCSCLRPALMLIPEGDWFCPPCQHNLLVLKLQENLKKFDQHTKRHENELLRKKRLAFVGISLDNVLYTKEAHKTSRRSSRDSDNDSSSSASSSSSGSSSSEESEPVYQLRERRCANTYKFNEYDDMINAAIQDEVEAVRGAGNQGRGKDIATIVNAEKEEAQAEAMKKTQHDVEEDEDDEKKLEKDSDEDYKAEKDEDAEEEDDDDEKPKILAKKPLFRKKHRKLNSLDISSEDDPESDEDFKGSSSDDDDDPEDQGSSTDDSAFANNRRRGRRGGGAPVRRSTRARMTRYDEDFINDDSDDSDRPKKKKSRSVWDESESEESDNSWRQRKKRSKTVPTPKSRSTNKSKSKKRRKKKRVIESDKDSDNEEEEEEKAVVEETSIEKNEPEESTQAQPIPDSEPAEKIEDKNPRVVKNEEGEMETNKTEDTQEKYQGEEIPALPIVGNDLLEAKKKKESTPKRKKTPPIRRKIIYGGLDNYPKQEEETLGRRTRGKKINYQEVLASDSEEELKKALKKTEESEDEFVVNEVEDLNEEAEKDSDSGDIYSPKKEGPKVKGKSPKGKKPRKSKSPATKQKLINDNETPKARKKPGPKPGSKNKPRSSQKMNSPFNNPRSGGEEGDVTEEGSLAGLGPEELAELDEDQLDQMMMEDEEYGKRQLELAAIEIAKKKKEEREAKKLEKARLKALEILAAERQRDPNAPEGTDGEAPKKKKRGRKSKAEILAEQMRRDGAPSNLSIESTSSPNVTTAIISPIVTSLTANSVVTTSSSSSPSLSSVNMNNPNLSSFLNPHTGINLAPNITAPNIMVPNIITTTTNEAQKIPESLVPVMTTGQPPPLDAHGFSPEGMIVKPKRRGRGKGKKTLALEAARAAEAAAKTSDHISGFGTDSNPEMKSDDPNVLPTPGSSTSGSAPSTPPASIVGLTPSPQSQSQPLPSVTQPQNYPPMQSSQQQQQSSVITRMLQSQPVSGGPQSFAAAAAAMGHKYFGAPNSGGNIMGVSRPGFDLQPRGRIPSPYRQPGQSPMPPHFAAVRSGTPPMRMRVPGPQMYHTPHHPMDPSPSGGGPISITSSRDRSSPLGPGPGPPMIPPAAGSPLNKGGPTPPPPPPPYARGVPPMGRFSDNSSMGGGGPRHQIPTPFANPAAAAAASGNNHNLQQPSPPPNRAPGNFSPYHPPPPPNYHYGAYPPPPPMTTADDAAAYQGSPYNTEHFSTPGDNPANIQPPPPPPPPVTQTQAQTHSHSHTQQHTHSTETTGTGGNKQFDEEGTGEFGGLVSYFSSQREDDLDS